MGYTAARRIRASGSPDTTISARTLWGSPACFPVDRSVQSALSVVAMKRSSFVAAAVAGAALLASGTAFAQGFSVNRFEPSERGSDWFTNESLDLRGAVRPAFGVVGDYQYRPL